MTSAIIARSDVTLSEAIQRARKYILLINKGLMNFFRTSAVRAKLLPKICAQPHAGRKAIEIELFIRRMRIVVGQGESQQERVSAELALKIIHNWNRAALADEHGLVSKALLQGA